MSHKNSGLIAAIVFASVTISGSLIFFTLQLKESFRSQAFATDIGENDATQKNIQGKQAYPEQSEKNVYVPTITEDDHIRGDKEAEISLIEYSDFECPFCRLFHATSKQILDTYNGKVNLVYRHFPLSFHQNAQKEAEASECANELGGNVKFWEYTDMIFERTTSNGTGFAFDALVPLAREIGLDEKKFKECLDSGKYANHVQQDFAEGSALGITGTPGNILLNHRTQETVFISGAQPYNVFQTAINAMLKK